MEKKNTPAVRTKLATALENINAKLKNMQTIADSPFQTNGELKWNPQHTHVAMNIHRVTDMKPLITAHSYIGTKAKDWEDSCKALGMESFPVFEWQGFTWKQWENDIKIRLAIVSQKTELKKLNRAKNKLEKFLTEEDQLEMTLKELGFNS